MEKLTEPTGIRTRDPSFSLHRCVTQAARPHCSARSSSIALFLTAWKQAETSEPIDHS